MVSSSKFESLAQRFSPYLEEFHEFFRSRRVPFGSPTDLDGFAIMLSDGAFHEEMVSMVRSILYREDEGLPRTELMEMIALAVGGPQVDSLPDLHTCLRPILTFVTEVVRSQRAAAIPPDLRATEASGFGTDGSVDDVADQVSPLSYGTSPVLVEPEAITFQIVAPTPPQSADFAPVHDPKTSVPAAEVAPRAPGRTRVMSFLRRAYWIPGVCVLLLVLAMALVLQHRTEPAQVSVPVVAAASPAVSRRPKPSPYGLRPSSSRSASVNTDSAPGTPDSVPAAALTQPVETNDLDGAAASAPARTARRAESPIGHTPMTPRLLGGREGVFLASSGTMTSHLLVAPAPSYPKLASLTHVEGAVIVQVVVGRNGNVEATRVLEGPHLLRAAAEHAIHHWRYRPYLLDGKPTDVATIVTVNFRLSR